MALRLSIENEKLLPDGGPTSYTVSTKGAVEIGRAQYLDWVLPDPNKVVSNKHCEIRWKDDAYWLSDTSTNGTFLNSSEDRMQESVRLKDGDRIAVGHYIIAVTIDDVDVPQRALSLPRAVGLGDLWGDAAAAPPIDPKLLRPREKVIRTNDFLNRVADLPWIDAPAAPAPAPARPGTSSDGEDDWLPRREPAPPPAPPPSPPTAWEPPAPPQPMVEAPSPAPPAPYSPPRSEFVGSVPEQWMPAQNPRQQPSPPPPDMPPPPAPPPPAPPERRPQPSIERSSAPPPAPAVANAEFLERFAEGLGIPARALAGRDPGDFAADLGRLVRMVTTHLKALLDDRQQAKRAFRVSNHTMIAAFENNPLKFQPTVDHALAIMFGPPNENYQDARASLEEGFKDLAEHQILTLSAMQKAVQLLEKELAPPAIEASVQAEKGLASIVGRTHGRFWDAYVHRWNDRTKYQGDGLNGAFMRDFAKCYDDLQKGSK